MSRWTSLTESELAAKSAANRAAQQKLVKAKKAMTIAFKASPLLLKAFGYTHTAPKPKKPVKRIPTEHEEQAAVIQWWAGYAAQHKIPENLLFAIPNGANKSMATAAKFKREGLRKGVPDLFLAVSRGGFHGLFVEMKRVKNSYASDDQNYFSCLLMGEGYEMYFCFGAEPAIRVIKEYLGVE